MNPETPNQRRGRLSKSRGKQVERLVAKLVGGKRMPDVGGQWADIQTATHVIECKSRQTPTPALIRGAWEQALAAAEATGKEPLVILCFKERGKWRMWEVREMQA